MNPSIPSTLCPSLRGQIWGETRQKHLKSVNFTKMGNYCMKSKPEDITVVTQKKISKNLKIPIRIKIICINALLYVTAKNKLKYPRQIDMIDLSIMQSFLTIFIIPQ